MSVTLKLPSGNKDIAAIVVRDAGNVSRTIQEAWLRLPSGLKQVFGKLSLTADPLAVYGSRAGHGTVTARTEPVTVTPTGGAAPVSFAWTRIAADSHAWTIDNPASAITTFTTNVAVGVTWSATFRCTATDAAGATATVDVTAECSNDGGNF